MTEASLDNRYTITQAGIEALARSRGFTEALQEVIELIDSKLDADDEATLYLVALEELKAELIERFTDEEE